MFTETGYHLCERLQDGVRHVVLDHALGDEHLVEAAVLRPHRPQLGIHVGRTAGEKTQIQNRHIL